MSNITPTASKVRDLVTSQTITADGAVPTFPAGPSGTPPRMSYAGDFQGADIAGFEYTTGALTGVTALGCNIEHSHDGVAWTLLKALTSSTAASTSRTSLADSDPKPLRHFRANFTATGAYGSVATVRVRVIYDQPRPPGHMRPPGMVDRAY